LELGSGVGLDATYFKGLGFDVLATDLSEDMIASCKEKGLNAEIIDMYELDRLGRVFDGIYSMNVLLHTPRNDLRLVLTSIENALSSRGLFFYGVYGGEDIEKVITDNKRMGLPRFFSFLSDTTLQEIVKNQFTILKFETIETDSKEPWFHFQAMYLQKKY
jgi:SAM-dependent methyltransferase